MNRWTTAGVVALPGLVLAGFGLVHPAGLSPATATAWWQLHIPLLPLFPLLALGVIVLLRGERGPLAWVARIGAYLYGCLYTALDTISGISAGRMVEALGDAAPVGALFAVGDRLGQIGIIALAVANLLVAGLLARTAGWRVIPGSAVLLVAAWGFYLHHIFHPYGALSMVGYAIGYAALAVVARPALAG